MELETNYPRRDLTVPACITLYCEKWWLGRAPVSSAAHFPEKLWIAEVPSFTGAFAIGTTDDIRESGKFGFTDKLSPEIISWCDISVSSVALPLFGEGYTTQSISYLHSFDVVSVDLLAWFITSA